MRTALAVTCILASALLGCASRPGTGGGGSGGSHGNDGTGGSLCAPPECHPAITCNLGCDPGQVCDVGACYDAYTPSFLTCPALAGSFLSASLEVRPHSGQPPIPLAQLVVTATIDGNATSVSVTPVTGQDNLFKAEIDLARARQFPQNGHAVSISAHDHDSMTSATCDVVVDTMGPQLSPDPIPSPLYRRDDPIVLTASVSEPHMASGEVMARLAGQDDPAPAGFDVSRDGWVAGTPVDGPPGSGWTFTLDQRQASLPGMEGKLVPWFWARDQLGNTTLLRSDYQPSITRQGWIAAKSLPGAPFVPAVWHDKVAVLAAGTKDNLALFDAGTGKEDTFSAAGSMAPVATAGGDYYLVSLDHVWLWNLSGGPVHGCQAGGPITSAPLLLSPGGTELVAYSRSDGAVADLAVQATACGTESASAGLGAANAVPAATVDASGQTILITGGRRPTTISTFVVGGDGALTQPSSAAPAVVNSLDVPLAIDGETVVAAPGGAGIAAAFHYPSGFQAAPSPRTFTFDSVPAGSVGPPVVSQHAVLFPTGKGIHALPRAGSWSRAAVAASDEAFEAPALAGEGDILYALSRRGMLYALRYRETPAPTLDTLWSTRIGSGETFSASPALTCAGVLLLASEQGSVHALVVDSKGLDPRAPWPKIFHDGRNTGSAATSLACPEP